MQEQLAGHRTEIAATSATRPRRRDQCFPSSHHKILVEHLPVMFYTADPNDVGAIAYHSPQIVELLGYPPEDWLADPSFWHTRLHPDDVERVRESDARANSTGEPFTIEYRLLTRDGRTVWIRDSGVLIRDPDGHPLYWQGVTADITEQKLLEEQLIHQARHDALTELPNRTYFGELLAAALQRRTGRSDNVAVLFLDLDNFKLLNDSLGHQAGDELLVEAARRVRRAIRAGDSAARLGGDEFAILLENASLGDGVQVAKRLITALHRPIEIAERAVQVTCSVGIALSIGLEDQPGDLLRWADLAMYQAKKAQGRNCYAIFEPALEIDARVRLDLGQQLRDAVEQGQFVVHYQPTVDLRSGEICGVESLVRWEHPARGLMLPGEFISVAEDTGLISTLGAQVLRESCHQVQRWNNELAGRDPLTVSVNLSAHQLHQDDLLEMTQSILEESGAEPTLLTVEITESALIEDIGEAVAVLEALAALGVQIAIDDFGIGFSSLSNLRRFPIRVLKIDQQFVAGLGINVRDTVVVSGIIELAHGLGLKVVAEGIETEEQYVKLCELGCDYGQGYFISRPRCASGIRKLLTCSTQRGQVEANTGN